MKQRTTIMLLVAAMTILVGSHAAAQVQLIRQVIGSGATAAVGANGAIAGTIGQTIIGRSTSSSNTGYLGFWYVYPNPINPLGVREEYSNAVAGLSATVAVAPNPATDRATITLGLPASGRITVKIYGALGQEVMSLVDGTRERGTVAVDVPVGELPSGTYSIVLQSTVGRASTSLRVVH